MNLQVTRLFVLNPLERVSEIACGLIMVLSFTGALSVTHAGEAGVHRMLIAAILCNLTWGIIDATFYLIGCLAEYSRGVKLLLNAQESTELTRKQQIIASVLPSKVAEALSPSDFERIHAHLKNYPPPATHLRLTGRNLRGALGVFLLVFLSTFPVVVPFMIVRDARLALHLSNFIAIALLFSCGCLLASYTGLRPVRTGLAMVAIGGALVALMIALGG
jgi:VIT1/CCC1 family predicted Fe2+/Mn2+ transporter